MSRSYRSQKESVTAERRIERTADGSPQLPRIIERAPAPGDSHPIPKRVLRRFLQRAPVEFIYGLSRIELRARELPLIGAPFGSYWVGYLDPKRADQSFADYTVEELNAFLSGYQLTHDPGTKFEYSSLGAGLLGHVIALKAGSDYESLVVDRICRPLKMDSRRIS